MTRINASIVLAASLLIGCQSTVRPDPPLEPRCRVEYCLQIPHEVPLVIEIPAEDGGKTEQLGREWYAAAHRDGWYECLDRFLAGELRLTEPMPRVWVPTQSVLAGEARTAGFRECFIALQSAAGEGEAGLRARVQPPTWHDRVDHYLDSDTRRIQGETDWADQWQELPEASTREWALELLLKTSSFTNTGVGAAGGTPIQLRAFKIVMEQPDAATALRDLLERGQGAGQLFALCGLYFSDPASYRRGVAKLRGDDRTITHWSGCIGSNVTVGEMVESRDPIAVRLRPGQTIDEWFDENETGVFDIVGGGWPHVFRDKLARMDQEDAEDQLSADSLLGK